jgi:hypothetical protein
MRGSTVVEGFCYAVESLQTQQGRLEAVQDHRDGQGEASLHAQFASPIGSIGSIEAAGEAA